MGKRKKGILNKILINLILLYQKITKNKAHKCLHHPSCSNYGLIAYREYSFIGATLKIIKRVRDCHPFSNRKYIDYP